MQKPPRSEGVLKSIAKGKVERLGEEERGDLSKLSSLVGLSKGPPKLTKANVDKLQTIARRGPDKPSSVGEIMGYTFVGSMLAFLAYLQFGLGLGSAKMGSPTAN
ncbi:hypothetical protein PHYSODRAFT_322869 [Phytophthora sojae]|uniref:Uncharacterized protein n=1 Tax=Phytophthora sojae (strain P6497) TaxID=1094619 RepID=G4YQ23_PHYSP|nr:hypothetical protein PHYSODRAFT_322869 [Phytophthora sojae]EGZ29338.1 hypothetical protein PHYSODRAFT_322869 [Phytophthora sojae]|eukprot:XP_009516613.1 hypothetical protein PHYSODRAFT_322869 [Phytophthora sojae]